MSRMNKKARWGGKKAKKEKMEVTEVGYGFEGKECAGIERTKNKFDPQRGPNLEGEVGAGKGLGRGEDSCTRRTRRRYKDV